MRSPETAGSLMATGAAVAGRPVSTPPTTTEAIVGVGARCAEGIAGWIVWAWTLTMPAPALGVSSTLLGRLG